MTLFVTRHIRSPCAGQVRNAKREWNARPCTTTGSKPATYIPTANISPCELATLATKEQVFRSLRDRKHRSRPRGFLIRDLCIRGDWLSLVLAFANDDLCALLTAFFVISNLVSPYLCTLRGGRLRG
jgi:hypothetical protein